MPEVREAHEQREARHRPAEHRAAEHQAAETGVERRAEQAPAPAREGPLEREVCAHDPEICST